MNLSGSKTEKNLLKTFAGESRARNKYNFYAEKAYEEGYPTISMLFNETAENEKAHARRVYRDFLKQVKSTECNLEDAIEGETEESKKLYKEFEKVARSEGFAEIATFYKEIAEVEDDHSKNFSKTLKRLKCNTLYESNHEIKWQCMNCGYIHEGEEAPERCPLCAFPKSYFERYCNNQDRIL